MKISVKSSIQAFFIVLNLSQVCQADIFGQDDRKEAYLQDHVKAQRQAVAVGVLSSLIDPPQNGIHKIFTDTLADYMCPDERFSDQSSVAYACTGYLVAPDLLVTAGHCSTHDNTRIRHESKLYCESYSWVFDYYKSAQPLLANKNSVYKCKKILFAVQSSDSQRKDFALIQLDRPVKSRQPLKIAKSTPRLKQSVYMLGHPMGLPMKLTNNAIITHLNALDSHSILTNLDAQSGNSGSPVLNSDNEVIGTLVGGLPNLVTYKNKIKRCERYNYCDELGKNCVVAEAPTSSNALMPASFSEVQLISKYDQILKHYIEGSRKRFVGSDKTRLKKDI